MRTEPPRAAASGPHASAPRPRRARPRRATRTPPNPDDGSTAPDRQDQERRLEGVLDLVPVAEHGSADAKHHRAVPSQEGRERQLGGLVVLVQARGEPIQQLVVAQGRR